MGRFGRIFIIFALWASNFAWAEMDACEALLESRFRDAAGQIRTDITDAQIFTPKFGHYWLSTEFDPGPKVIGLLEEGRKLTTEPTYLRSSPYFRIRMILDLIGRQLTWDQRMACKPVRDFEIVARSGKASCQHFAMLFAAVASEAGMSLKFVRHIPLDDTPGHVWLEVGDYVVDPTFNYVRSFGQVVKRARRDSKSYEAIYYAHPRRLYDDVF